MNLGVQLSACADDLSTLQLAAGGTRIYHTTTTAADGVSTTSRTLSYT